MKDTITKNFHLLQQFLKNPMAAPLAEEIVLKDLAQNCIYQRRTAVQGLLRGFFAEGFSEVMLQPLTMLADEKSAIAEFIFYGCQNGVFMSIPATGQRVAVPMVIVCQMAEESVRAISWYYDAGTLLRQLGFAL